MTPTQRNLQELAASVASMKHADDSRVASPDLLLLMEQGLHHVFLPTTMQPGPAEAMQRAFEGMGGLPRLLMWADRYPASFYKLYARMIAATVAPVLPPPPTQTTEKWPSWLTHRRLAYQESATIAQDIRSRDVEPG